MSAVGKEEQSRFQKFTLEVKNTKLCILSARKMYIQMEHPIYEHESYNSYSDLSKPKAVQ